MDKYPDIIHAMGEVVRRGGFGTSVTPVSQFYFQQAFNNVMFGPWEKIAEGYGKMVLGYFGRTPVEPDPEIVVIASKQLGLEPTKKTPLEINDADPKKGLTVAAKLLEAAGIEKTDENLFIAAACKDKGIAYLQGEAKLGIRKTQKQEKQAQATSEAPEGYTVTVDGKAYSVFMEGPQATINGKTYQIDVQEGASGSRAVPTDKKQAATADAEPIKAPMPGTVVRVCCVVGDSVKSGDEIVVLEAMKMEAPIKAPCDGTISSISVAQGDQVTSGQILAYVN